VAYLHSAALIWGLDFVQLTWRLDGESTVYNLELNVLPACAYLVILGREFLEPSKTFKRRIHPLNLEEIVILPWISTCEHRPRASCGSEPRTF
jgi:hypothetical protein